MGQTHRASAKSNHASGAAHVPLTGSYQWSAMHAWLKEVVVPEVSAHVIHVVHALGDATGKYVTVHDAD